MTLENRAATNGCDCDFMNIVTTLEIECTIP